MKKTVLILLGALLLVLSFACSSTGAGSITIAVPNDATNEARALLLLEASGLLTLKEGVGIAATKLDIAENPYNITIEEIEASQLPALRTDFDYAVINSNYALGAELNPVRDALVIEGSESAYANILAVKAGTERDPKLLALKAALESAQVATFLAETYGGAVVGVVEHPTDGYDPSLDYASLAGVTVSVAASPTPHAEILAVAKEILAVKGITLQIVEFTDYVQPNNVVDSGEIDANYFQHLPYLNDFNENNGTSLVSLAQIHVEPLGLYGGKQSSLAPLQKP